MDNKWWIYCKQVRAITPSGTVYSESTSGSELYRKSKIEFVLPIAIRVPEQKNTIKLFRLSCTPPVAGPLVAKYVMVLYPRKVSRKTKPHGVGVSSPRIWKVIAQ
jgi:hypothetical protein